MGGRRGGTTTTTTTGDIAPTLKPAAEKTIGEAGTLYDQGKLGQVAGDQTTGALQNLAGATGTAVGEQQAALRGAASNIGQQAGNITGQLDQSAALANAQDILGQQRGQQALTGGLGGARALRANNQLASRVGSDLAAQQAQFGNQAALQRAGLYGQQGQIGAQAGALGTQQAQADLAAAQNAQAYQQRVLDAPGQALAQYGQLLSTPGSFVGTSSSTTAPRQGGK